MDNIHKNLSHEDIRYQSMYLQEYWKEKHDIDFLGKLWRGALIPEHYDRKIAGVWQKKAYKRAKG
ncbi:DUF6055 domain-containing protein [Mariniflexile sp. HMF6888]|uniref:DUF6055 domain-containing protein n=1 Tax=Mariniflexile sp. HMF6888 TaxID=3373086 RepID=UPI0037B8A297